MRFDQYVGEPYTPRGCWELLRRVYAEQLGIVLPTYDAELPPRAERPEFARLILAESVAWQTVEPGAERVGDGVLFEICGQPSHVGIVTTPKRGRFLHAAPGSQSCIECYRSPKWARRLVGFYRHAAAP